MEIEIRSFKQHDYDRCEELVNEAWHFDEIIRDKILNKTALRIYTAGGLCSGNMNLVAVDKGRVVGFLFGFNHLAKIKPQGRIKLAIEAIISFNFKKMDKLERNKFLQALAVHNKNRTLVEPGKASEICLFVVSQDFRGKNIGTKLWEKFRDACIATGVKRIRVETNKLGASSYYEKQGFIPAGDFDSPLHELATPGGQACMYEYLCDKI
ncbi:MAG: GNAT family N-acetyltransferase [Bacteroidales bacterium]|nr:GNAT family N-acetyltransferase [Bacteroidales bacterium]